MKTANIMKVVCVASLAATCAWGLAACSSNASSASTGAVAATVNGTEISEDQVTSTIEGIRTQMGLETEDAWGQWLADNSLTPESVREEMIDSLAQQELIKQGAKEKNISIEGSEIDDIVTRMKANYENDEKWASALEQAGFTEAEYRSNIESQLLQSKLTESFATTEDPSQEEMLQYAQMYASAYDGAKRSSHILFDAGDEATAQSVLDQINNGTLDFAEAAKQYSKDSSAENGGDVGWDKMNSFVTAYTDALNGLEKDQVSGLVTSDYGIHIIKCTDVFVAPKTTGEDGTETVLITSTDQVPSEFLDSVKTSLNQQKQQTAVQEWFTAYTEAADIQINPMPEGLPYAVDMSKYQAADSANATAEGTETTTESIDATATTESTDAAATTESTSTESSTATTQQPAEAA